MLSRHFKGKVEPIEVKEKSISQLLAEMAKTAYQGRKKRVCRFPSGVGEGKWYQ